MIDDVAVGWSKGKKRGSIPRSSSRRSSRVAFSRAKDDESDCCLWGEKEKNVKKLDARPFSSSMYVYDGDFLRLRRQLELRTTTTLLVFEFRRFEPSDRTWAAIDGIKWHGIAKESRINAFRRPCSLRKGHQSVARNSL